MEPQPDDDMMFICSEDGLALTGYELRNRSLPPDIGAISSAGKVLHAWDITDENEKPMYREYVTTSGHLVSDEEVVAQSQVLAEAYVDPRILQPDAIKKVAESASGETDLGGLRKRHSETDTEFLRENAEAIAGAMREFQLGLSGLWIDVWEEAHPYLVGEDYHYFIPLKDSDGVDIRDDFIDFCTDYDDINDHRAAILWEAVDPFLRVPIDVYIEGEQVA